MATNIQQARAALTARIWQTIAQSGIDVSSIPAADLQTLVGRITDDVLVEFDQMLEGMKPPSGDLPWLAAPQAAATGGEEQVLWQGRPFLSLVTYYVVTTERIRVTTGLLGKDHENIELVRVKDVDWDQSLTERVLNIGDITVHSVDASRPDFVLYNVAEPAKVFEILRRAMLEARKKYPVIFEQQM